MGWTLKILVLSEQLVVQEVHLFERDFRHRTQGVNTGFIQEDEGELVDFLLPEELRHGDPNHRVFVRLDYQAAEEEESILEAL